ncbi:hypothetical protein PV05_10370 [Exophiala xenobiotica]|uniref:Uncharacterized protein n=1 Tax=Exophiala xenobiotica TaxID=348802 RepID=A0A0D2BHD5_9EURO|nr:uncharacterized protein PV05_10370 [Exophiala xenobiotica]KIW51671.1 hypothetical protein PV05_10370 [Exophiala xenobiotica]
MEDDLRSFQSVSIGLTSVESGRERFARDGLYHPPPLAYWRNNLTALSQHYNLYFVANRDSIAVYRPEFPFQKLRKLPSLLIPATLAQPLAEGYIDTYSPHTINHMIVGDLGSEEIVLVATDSGNVTAYFTKAIDEAIRRDPYRFSTNARSDYVGVRAFFTQWVYESAWGLSIHSKARMIAVSANTPHHVPSDDPCSKITVFAFALTEQSDSDRDPQDDDSIDIADHAKQPDWEEWQCKGGDPAPPPRDKNYKITLGGFEGHNHNIPSVSFVNTDDDNDGRWLLSTDIGGEMKMWLIWQGYCLKTWDFAEKRMRSGFFRRREGGWIVAALDPKAFRLARSMEQFCGHSKATKYAGHIGESYDLTNIVRLRTPGNSLAHPNINGAPLADAADEDGQETYDSWSDLGESDDDDVSSNAIMSVQNDGAEQAREPSATADQENGTGTDMEMADSVAASHSHTASDDAELARENEEADADSVQALLFDTEQSGPDDDDEEEDEEEDEDAEGHYGLSSEEQEGQSSNSHRSATSQSSLAQRNSEEAEDLAISEPNTIPPTYVQHPSEQAISSWMRKAAYRLFRSAAIRSEVPSIPTLHCTASNLRLLMAPEASAAHVFCANILKQALPENIEMTNHVQLDRINMIQQIPELGIVIIASQIGRCAICTLTRNEKTGDLGLRVDWILPSRKQELRHVRPYMPLLGIATSPVQGRFVGQNHKGRLDPEASNEWGSDGVVDGVPTTFDPAVVVVSEDELEHAYGSSGNTQHEIDEDMVEKSIKTSRSSTNSPPTSTAATSQTREWKKPRDMEPWIAGENSRRYRLMLTYLDMSVLTYEISRAVEREDVAQDEVSALESVD